MCPHECNVALCRVALKNVALGLSLVGHRCPIPLTYQRHRLMLMVYICSF